MMDISEKAANNNQNYELFQSYKQYILNEYSPILSS